MDIDMRYKMLITHSMQGLRTLHLSAIHKGKQMNTYLFRALNISIVTSTDKAIVMGWRSLKIWQSTPTKLVGSVVHCM